MKKLIIAMFIYFLVYNVNAQIESKAREIPKAFFAIIDSTYGKINPELINIDYEEAKASKAIACGFYKVI